MILHHLFLATLIFLLGYSPSLADSESTSAPDQQAHKDTALITRILVEDLATRTFSFAQVIQSATSHNILPFDPKKKSHQTVLAAIQQAAKESIIELNQASSPIKNLGRINEASRYFEDILLKKLNAHPELLCTIPNNSHGKAQRAGYPDIRIKHSSTQEIFYLDPKLFQKKASSIQPTHILL